jgi:uroporphyrinogen decarboxylase
MKCKKRIQAILENERTDRVGFWPGNPTDEAKSIYFKAFGAENDIDLALKLDSDLFWFAPELDPGFWKHPDGKPMFDVYPFIERKKSWGKLRTFAECENPAEIDSFDWPDPDYADFSATIGMIDKASSEGLAIFSGMWMPFFHTVADFFGMEEYFMKMHTHPEVIEAITEKVLDFYLECNRRLLDTAADRMDALFFGNDFGSQQDLMISPASFERFILPGIRRIIEQAGEYNLKVALHSCGSIVKIIPMLIDAGVDALHPLQAMAGGMEAERLAREFKGDLVFIGGVDTQRLLPFGTPEDIKTEVRRLRDIFGERYIVSPSHEALLPNVSRKMCWPLRKPPWNRVNVLVQ